MIIFLHIPKTAGTTLNFIINRNYSPGAVYTIDPDRTLASMDEFRRLDNQTRRRFQVVRGHMYFGIHDAAPSCARYITLMRNPHEQVISQYYDLLRRPSNSLHLEVIAKGIGVSEYVHQTVWAHDGQTRLLSGSHGIESDLCHQECGPTHVQAAKENIAEHFALAGVSERFDEALLILRRRFGWRNIFYVSHNVTAERPYRSSIPMDVRNAIARYNQCDLELYSHVREQFDDTVRSLGRRFQVELRVFRALNNAVGRLYGSRRAKPVTPGAVARPGSID